MLDASRTTKLLSDIPGLESSDALISIQADGRVMFAPEVTIAGVTSGDTIDLSKTFDVTIDLKNVTPGTITSLYFDLVGFGEQQSQAAIGSISLDSALSWHNQLLPRDTTGDGFVVPQDVLVIINELNNPIIAPDGVLPLITDSVGPPPYFDVNDDGYVAPNDVLMIVNYLNSLPEGEGEFMYTSELTGRTPDGLSVMASSVDVLTADYETLAVSVAAAAIEEAELALLAFQTDETDEFLWDTFAPAIEEEHESNTDAVMELVDNLLEGNPL